MCGGNTWWEHAVRERAARLTAKEAAVYHKPHYCCRALYPMPGSMESRIVTTSDACSSPDGNNTINRAAFNRWWEIVCLRCGGCLSPTTTLRLLGTLALAFGVLISSLEGTLLVREEQHYQHCLLRHEGLVAGRHGNLFLTNFLSTCYPYNINLVRGMASVGVLLLVVYILVSLLLLVAVRTERWQLCLPWAYMSMVVGVQEVLLMGICWSLLYIGDIIMYLVHIFLLVYSVVVLASFLQQATSGDCETEATKVPEPHSTATIQASP